MEARRATLWAVAAAALLSVAARYQTANFVVTAPNAQIAEQVGQAAEHHRRELAKEWLGKEMPDWSRPCPIQVKLERGAGGVTSFRFEQGEVFGWNMVVQGPLDQILQSVLPHEVTHTIFASHFRQPLPRWADEGACTTVEHPSERAKQNKFLHEFLRTGRGISFTHLFRMKEYPRDMLPLYAQGHSLATYLLGQGGKQKFLEYLADGMRNEDWNGVTRKFYGYDNLGTLQNSWLDWVQKGSPDLMNVDPTTIAAREAPRTRGGNMIYRAQSSDPPASRSPAAPPPGSSGGRLAPVRPSSPVPSGGPANAERVEKDGRVGSADSPGWRSPQVFPSARESTDGPRETARGPDWIADGPSRYSRSPNPIGAARVPGQHLPDTGGPNTNSRLMVPSAPFSLPSSPAMMPCLPGGG